MAKLLLGPVVGKVTATTARILAEIDKTSELECILSANGNDISRSVNMQKNRPGVFQFADLIPDTRYAIAFRGATDSREGSLKTYADDTTSMNIAAVSCNFTIRKGDTNLWNVLRDRYVAERHIDLILHLGDQVYGDDTFARALELISSKGGSKASKDRKIAEAYRALYRRTWNFPPTRDVLANASNLMIWDDHEIRDDWGSLETDKDPDSVEQRIGRIARGVFREYQRQLWDDFDTNAEPSSGYEDHAHVWGKIGVLFIDQRGGRSFEPEDKAFPFLGAPQWERIRSHFGDNGLFEEVAALIVVTSVPLAYLGSNMSNAGAYIFDDLMDHWNYGSHRKEQIEMIRLLRTWKQARPGRREVLVVGGDVHVGGMTTILHEGEPAFRQLVTSPITNRPPASYLFYLLKGLLELNQTLGDNYSFEHSGFTNERNFGIIMARVPPPQSDATVRLEPSLVTK